MVNIHVNNTFIKNKNLIKYKKVIKNLRYYYKIINYALFNN